MNKAESKGRVFRAGIIAAVIVALAGLSACDGFVLDDQADRDWEMGMVDTNGLVQVRVPIPGEVGNRSVANGRVKTLIDYYEVVFYDPQAGAGEKKYYRSTATVGRDFLTVSVKPDRYYHVLFLAGIKSSRVLLSCAFSLGALNGANHINPGQANTVTLTVGMTNLTPDDTDGNSVGDDIVFTDPGSGEVVYARDAKGIATLAVDSTWATITNPSSVIEVKLHQTKLLPLFEAAAQVIGAGVNPFLKNTVTLYAPYGNVGHNFTAVEVPITSGNHNGLSTYLYEISTAEYAKLVTLENPTPNVDGMLRLQLQYQAFGTNDSGGMVWEIRNGIFVSKLDVDDGGDGGLIKVQFGTGSEFLSDVDIILN